MRAIFTPCLPPRLLQFPDISPTGKILRGGESPIGIRKKVLHPWKKGKGGEVSRIQFTYFPSVQRMERRWGGYGPGARQTEEGSNSVLMDARSRRPARFEAPPPPFSIHAISRGGGNPPAELACNTVKGGMIKIFAYPAYFAQKVPSAKELVRPSARDTVDGDSVSACPSSCSVFPFFKRILCTLKVRGTLSSL